MKKKSDIVQWKAKHFSLHTCLTPSLTLFTLLLALTSYLCSLNTYLHSQQISYKHHYPYKNKTMYIGISELICSQHSLRDKMLLEHIHYDLFWLYKHSYRFVSPWKLHKTDTEPNNHLLAGLLKTKFRLKHKSGAYYNKSLFFFF